MLTERAAFHRALGSRLRRRRRDAGMTQKELSAASGVSFGSVCNYERARAEPTAWAVYSLAAALGCTVDDLIGRW